MKKPRKNHKVLITTGKHQGEIGLVTFVEDDRAMVQILNVPYERSYSFEDLEYKGYIEQVLPVGEARRKKMQLLVKEGKLCPSFPHACNGTCGVNN